ncbi:phage tail protein [Ignatzschineria rhizosphaerae]|uniref:Phage tail protein n=1 Tax=Ignatzschineria rhizosphaerae TaxID=2923279 RepID=A0ABY3X680_9GAMM|nr:phage tail protein [Ignatzschineria rhizosphaerae]UNM95508.1 phage tail protein [Ignatzschineria rhizosphaerae]UNM96076.1 phage tail protein [Ignatzschineria rhizosphaerae]
MINGLKKLVEKYVKDPASVEIWIDEGSVEQEYFSLYLKELVVINLTNMIKPYPSVLGAIRVWYEENNGGLTEDELKKGMNFDVEVIKENDAFMQVRLKVRNRYIMKDDEGMIDAIHCP